MLPWELILAFFLGLALIYLIGWLLLTPMRFIWRFVAGGVLGGLALFMINQFDWLTGFSVPLNPFTALISGFLGLPGVALVIALQLLL